MIPKSVKYLLAVDLLERYSFYALRAIAVIFFIDKFKVSDQDASFLTHAFLALCYLFPIISGYLIDEHFTKYKYTAIIMLGYALSFFGMYFVDSLLGQICVQLTLAAFSGLFKPVVLSFVTDNTKNLDKKSQENAIDFYYLFVNIGSIFSFTFHPLIYKYYGYKISFLIPSIVMFFAFLFFVAGKKSYTINKPQKGMNVVHFVIIVLKFKFFQTQYKKLGLYLKNKHSQEYLKLFGEISRSFKALGLMALYFCVYETQYSTFITQGMKMKQSFLGFTLLAAQIGTLNPIAVMLCIPLFSKLYTVFKIDLKNRVMIGFGLTFLSLFLLAVVEVLIKIFGFNITVAFQIPSYILMAAGEVMVYGSALQLFFGKSSENIKSTIGSLFFFSIFLGNIIDAWFFKFFKPNIDVYFFLGCSGLMIFVSVLFKALKMKD
jgi:dipeptide/tripeptide permease